MTGERQLAAESDGGRGVACGAGWLSYERPGVSQEWISAVSRQDKTISGLQGVDARSHQPNES